MTTPLLASFDLALRHVFLRDMVLPASIGIYPHEHSAPQSIRINVDLGVDDDALIAGQSVGSDDLPRVVNYEKIASAVRAIVGLGHVRLVETLAERIAQACLLDQRVKIARIRVEKLGVFPDSTSAGVEIERLRKHSSTSGAAP